MGYKNASNPTENEAGSTSFGSDLYTSLVSLRTELGVDAMIGVKVAPGTVTLASPVVNECREFLKTGEFRDSLTILLVSNNDALQTVLGAKVDGDYTEALVDLRQPKDSHSKGPTPSASRAIAVIVVNFLILLGVSAFNIWQVRIFTGLENPSSESS